jgi:formylglycine-generating enzyme
VALWAAMSGACTQRDSPDAAASSSSAAASSATAVGTGSSVAPQPDAAVADAAAADADADAGADDRPLHRRTRDDLLALLPFEEKLGGKDTRKPWLPTVIAPGTPARINQGNPDLAVHTIGRAQCLAGLSGITLQTEAQKKTCGGKEMMVPVLEHIDEPPRACIDVFEFPNVPCELPFVWVPPAWADQLCRIQGKRLCTQQEWVRACGGDPAGGKPWKYAYGEELDLAACNTQKSIKKLGCDAGTAASAWKTCPTLTEPAGAFPRCRSRSGVHDMHGNVAEEMTRLDADGQQYSQLKGSAFFYVDVARKPGDAPKRENYSDHCAHDPRWHVEPMREAFHVNYHLGFRCCLSLD